MRLFTPYIAAVCARYTVTQSRVTAPAPCHSLTDEMMSQPPSQSQSRNNSCDSSVTIGSAQHRCQHCLTAASQLGLRPRTEPHSRLSHSGRKPRLVYGVQGETQTRDSATTTHNTAPLGTATGDTLMVGHPKEEERGTTRPLPGSGLTPHGRYCEERELLRSTPVVSSRSGSVASHISLYRIGNILEAIELLHSSRQL